MSLSISAHPSLLPPASAIDASFVDPAIHAVAANPALMACKNDVEFVMRTSSGKEYSFDHNNLSLAQKNRLSQIMVNLAAGSTYFEVNLTALVSMDDSNVSSFPTSEQQEIKELRELVRLSLGVNALNWGTFLEGQRGCQSGDQLFACRGSVLTDLEIDKKDRLHALNGKNLTTKVDHTPAQKQEILRRHAAGSELTNKTIQMLKNIEAGLKRNPPPTLLGDAQKTSVKKTLDRFVHKTTKQLQGDKIDPAKHTSTSVKNGAILLEALYPLDLSAKTHEEKKDALKEKEEAVEKILKARKEPRLDKKCCQPILGFIPNPGRLVPFIKSSESSFEDEKKAFAKDVALAGLQTREEFHVYGNDAGTGAELFFIQLQGLIAKDATDQEITDCVNGPYFQAAFGSLHPHLRVDAQTEMLEIAIKLRDVNTEVNAVPNVNNEALCDQFDAEYKTQLDLKFP